VDVHERLVKPAVNATAIQLVDAHRVHLESLEVQDVPANQDDKEVEEKLVYPVSAFKCQHNKTLDASDAHLVHQAHLVQWERQDNRDRKVHQAILDQMLDQIIRDHQDRRVTMVNLAEMDNQAHPVHQDKVERAVDVVLQVQLVNQVVQEEKVNVVQQEPMDNQEHQDQQDNQDLQVDPAAQVVVVRMAHQDNLVHRAMTHNTAHVHDAVSWHVASKRTTTTFDQEVSTIVMFVTRRADELAIMTTILSLSAVMLIS